MKLLLPLLVGGLVFGVALLAPEPLDDGGVHGRYLEVRSAAVFAGACHVNGEVDHQGRRALVGFAFDGGRHDGVELRGVRLAVALASEDNLADGAPRRSAVFVDENLEPRRADAAMAWLQARHGDALALDGRAEPTALALEVGDEQFRLDVEGVAHVDGAALADRACCTMPENVWYEPLAGPVDTVVGQALACRFEGAPGIDAWTYEGQNNAFVGTFAEPPRAALASAVRLGSERAAR